MPIRPDQRARYPKDWPAISLRIRARADWRCEFCGVPNAELGAWISGKWHKAEPKGTGLRDNPRHGETFPCRRGDSVIWTKLKRVVLTVAHLNHQPEDCRDENLKALCQRCHLAYDAKHHAANAAATRRKKAGVIDLFEVVAAEPHARPIPASDNGSGER